MFAFAGASWRVETDGDHAKLADCIARMAPINKAKAAGVSAGSFLELRAQVSKQKEGLSKGNTTAIVRKKDGKVRLSPWNSALFRPTYSSRSQKSSKWAPPNKGVHSRAARDLEQEVLDRRTVESARSILERKAKLYGKLKKGQSGGLSEAQFDGLLVDVSLHRPSAVARM